MTTVDSWPKTLPMPSAQSWNSTTETHLIYIVNSVLGAAQKVLGGTKCNSIFGLAQKLDQRYSNSKARYIKTALKIIKHCPNINHNLPQKSPHKSLNDEITSVS